MLSLPSNIFTPTFKQQHLGWLFMAIMAIMVYLATLAMALQIALSSTSLTWDQSQQGHITLSIPPADERAALPQDAQIAQILALLKNEGGIHTATLLPFEETARLLKPWLQDENLIRNLPLPALIDVQLKDSAKLSAATLRQKLVSITPDIHVDDHADWLLQLHQIVRALNALGWLLILLTGVALVIAISLICRAAMAVEHRTIDLIHIMGATDELIATTLARHALNLSWPAAAIGFSLALITVGGLAFLLRYFMVSTAPPSEAWLQPFLTLLVIPAFSIIGAVVTARTSVLNLLRRKP